MAGSKIIFSLERNEKIYNARYPIPIYKMLNLRLSLAEFERIRKQKWEKPSKRKNLVFHPVCPPSAPRFVSELKLAQEFARRGFKGNFLVNDGALFHTEHNQVSKNPVIDEKSKVLGACQRIRLVLMLRLISKNRIKPTFISSIKNRLQEEISNSCEVRRNDICRNYAIESARRYFESDDVRRGTEFEEISYENALLVWDLAVWLVGALPDAGLVISHGIYSSYGPMWRVFADSSRPILVIAPNVGIPGSLLSSYLPHQKMVEEFESRGVDHVHDEEESQKWTQGFLCRRRQLMTADNKIYYKDLGRRKKFSPELRRFLEEYGKSVFYFPNVAWDGNIYERNRLFKSMTESIVASIGFAQQHTVPLVVRFHPSEYSSIGGSRSLQKEVESAIEVSLGDHILFIPSDSDVDIYQFIDSMLFGIVYDSTIGLELIEFGVPVIGLGKGRAVSSRWCSTPESVEEFRDWFRDPGGCVLRFKEKLESSRFQMRKYLYWYHQVASFRIPWLREQAMLDVESFHCDMNGYDFGKMVSGKGFDL